MERLKKDTITEIYCSYCGYTFRVYKKELKQYKRCIFCLSPDINEA